MAETLVVGGDGVLGAALARRLGAQVTTRRAGGGLVVDLARPAAWPELPTVDVAILCAAESRLAACEQDPQRTRAVNVVATVELARRLKARGAFVVFLSSNHVFDGREPDRRWDAPTCPVNEYGRQKAETEGQLEGCAVLRLSRVITPIVDAWRSLLARGEPIVAAEDVAVAPVELDAAVAAVARIARARAAGVYQLSGPRDLSYFDLARHIAGGRPGMVRPMSARERGVPGIFLPRHTTLAVRLPEDAPAD